MLNKGNDAAYTPAYRHLDIPCLVCRGPLTIRPARGRRSGKPFIMLVCGRDGRHFRAFINDQEYVRQVLERVEDPQHGPEGSQP